mmetsp:Transcript_13446/g.34458  ORF Transcript_13446/g.34458 Transcript_13446/m.34458 type:complete len:223 (+) Transcript_13446:1085-1753(+)
MMSAHCEPWWTAGLRVRQPQTVCPPPPSLFRHQADDYSARSPPPAGSDLREGYVSVSALVAWPMSPATGGDGAGAAGGPPAAGRSPSSPSSHSGVWNEGSSSSGAFQPCNPVGSSFSKFSGPTLWMYAAVPPSAAKRGSTTRRRSPDPKGRDMTAPASAPPEASTSGCCRRAVAVSTVDVTFVSTSFLTPSTVSVSSLIGASTAACASLAVLCTAVRTEVTN